MSSFVEQSIRERVERRQARRDFIAGGLHSRAPAQRRDKCVSSEAVIRRLEGMLTRAKTSHKSRQVSCRVRFTDAAEADLVRLYEFIPARDEEGWALAQRALEAVGNAIRSLELSPLSCRKAIRGNPFLRELVISFGATGYVAMFEIDHNETVTKPAVRHRREDDCQ